MEYSTFILRFRDLVTPESKTIESHQEKIQEYGYVWWAWWKKGNEETPLSEFSELADIITDEGIDIYLVDSGMKKLYKANCKEIRYSRQEKKVSPEAEKTPEYYNAQDYYAWFKLSRIEEIDCGEIRKYSYVNISSLFVKSGDDYSRFDNKIVYSLDELIQQERTIWFVRPINEDDLDNEIVLLKPNQIQPTNFSKKFFQPYGNKILWLSDLHLSNSDFVVEKEDTNITLTEHITSIIDDDIGGLIITGDITDKVSEDGFNKALKLINDLKSEYQLNSENIAICPGNHDFLLKNKMPENNKPTKLSGNHDRLYKKFYQSVYHIKPNEYFCCGKKILLPNGICIEIASINSLYLQQYDSFKGQGYISQEQLNYIEEKMGWNKANDNAVRIAVMHHHYLPTCYTEEVDPKNPSSVVYDADRLMAWLIKHDIKLLLHGHKHKKFFAQVNYPYFNKDNAYDKITKDNTKKISIAAMGGTGCKCDENLIATIGFERSLIKIKYYRMFANSSNSDCLCQEIEIEV